jgi:shikimate dehydrogenase
MKYAEVIGDPIAQSKSPALHGFWLDQLGIDADYRRQRVMASELADHIAARRVDPDWRGCNVTIPYKETIFPLLDRIDPQAARIGAANIVVPEAGQLVGYNSDAPGFLEPLRPFLADRHLLRTARILGTGGAARAVAHALWDEGFTLIIAGRDLAKAEALAGMFDPAHVHVAALSSFAEPLDFDWGDQDQRLDLVVNTTSLGMTGQPPLAIDFSNVPPGAIVYDAVYAPLETPLLAEARARGHRTVDGLRMLVGQARIAFRHFFGAEPPSDEASDAALRAKLLA